MNGLNSSIEGGRLGEIVGPRQLGVNQKEEQDEIWASKIWKAIEKMDTLNYALRLILINVLPFWDCFLVLWSMCYLAEIEFDFPVVHTLTRLIYDHFHSSDKFRHELYLFDKLMNLFPEKRVMNFTDLDPVVQWKSMMHVVNFQPTVPLRCTTS